MKLNNQLGIRSNSSAGINKGANLKSLSIPVDTTTDRRGDRIEISGKAASIILDTGKCVVMGDLKTCGKLAGKAYLATRPTVQKAELGSIKNDPYMQYMLTEKDDRKRLEAALRNNFPVPPSDTAANVIKGAFFGGLIGLISGGPLGLVAGAITGGVGGGVSTSTSVNIN